MNSTASKIEKTPVSNPSASESQSSSIFSRAAAAKALSLCSVWVVFYLLCIDAALSYFKPLQYVHVPGLVFRDADHQLRKIDIAVSKGNADALLLGSSTLMAAAIRGDLGEKADTVSEETFGTYMEAKSLQEHLNKASAKALRVINVGVSGAMASDLEKIFSQYLGSNNKAPKAVVLFLSARDFADSNLPSPDKSRIAQHLHEKPGGGFLEASEQQIARLWRLYGVRGEYQKLLEVIAGSALSRQTSLYAAVQSKQAGASQTKPQITVDWPWLEKKQSGRIAQMGTYKKDLKDYYARGFTGVTARAMADQAAYLERLALTCREKGITLVMVRMPLSPEFQAVTPAPIMEFFEQTISKTTAQAGPGSLLIEFSPDAFADSDFGDGIHFNNAGASKFWTQLSRQLDAKGLTSRLASSAQSN
ncbi:MAG: hypothetical protein J0M35_14030 [Candidatus Obscuribacter phosphatis]|uniref:DUF1574 domain-containing protein n=1 Tax=Candidatus Obscuribacter phosphatis TaxID=1906157 RepID=A0A8J7TLW3_9BACT|nr:hypothetical protein [Candidatus Obscuribacter phosphatis]